MPCSAELAETRRPSYYKYSHIEEPVQTLVITEDGDIDCPTVLSEFSAVVTDTQEYLPPQEDVHDEVGMESIDASDVSSVTHVTFVSFSFY